MPLPGGEETLHAAVGDVAPASDAAAMQRLKRQLLLVEVQVAQQFEEEWDRCAVCSSVGLVGGRGALLLAGAAGGGAGGAAAGIERQACVRRTPLELRSCLVALSQGQYAPHPRAPPPHAHPHPGSTPAVLGLPHSAAWAASVRAAATPLELRSCLAALEAAIPPDLLPGFVAVPFLLQGAWANSSSGGGGAGGGEAAGSATPELASRAPTPAPGDAPAAGAGEADAGGMTGREGGGHACCGGRALVERAEG